MAHQQFVQGFNQVKAAMTDLTGAAADMSEDEKNGRKGMYEGMKTSMVEGLTEFGRFFFQVKE